MIEREGKTIALAFFPVVAINQIFPRNYCAKINIYLLKEFNQYYFLVNC
jgi:hypothetical protein